MKDSRKQGEKEHKETKTNAKISQKMRTRPSDLDKKKKLPERETLGDGHRPGND